MQSESPDVVYKILYTHHLILPFGVSQEVQVQTSLISFHPLCTGDLDASTEEHQATEDVHAAPESDGERVLFSLAPHWHPVSSRIRRTAGKISDICCERGCSMKELIQFC